MSRQYFGEFCHNARSYDPKGYGPKRKETDTERRASRAEEEREKVRESQRRACNREECHRRAEEDRRKKSEEDKGKGQVADEPNKRSKDDEKASSDAHSSQLPKSSVHIAVSSDAPALPQTDFRTILKMPTFVLPKAPTRLEATFPNWCLRGVRFDLPLTPIDKDAMLRNLEAIKQDVESLHNWQRLVDELQRVNHWNQDALLTMESDKAEWEKVLEAYKVEVDNITTHNAELEAQIDELNKAMAASSSSQTEREEMLMSQIRKAYDTQKEAEKKLFAEQQVANDYRIEAAQLRDINNSQALEISALKAQLAKAEKERDDARMGKAAAEQSNEDMQADFNSTLFDFYTKSVMGKGSLSFLGPQFSVTLAEVWEAVISQLRACGYTETEEEFQEYYLDDESHAALVRGKEQLERERAEAGIESSEETAIVDLALPSTSSDAVITQPEPPLSQILEVKNAPAAEENHDAVEKTSQEVIDDSDEAKQYEIQSRPHQLAADTSDVEHTSPPPVALSPTGETTPSLSQSGPHAEKIGALLDDPNSSQEIVDGSDVGGAEKTPKAKRRRKTTVSKKPTTSGGDERREEEDDTKSKRPKRLSRLKIKTGEKK